jgi:CheY-like chemotaxis protein
MRATQAAHILAAVSPNAKDTVLRLFHPEFQLTFCHSLADAKRLLRRQRFDVVFCNLQFDGSSTFDLLRHIKSFPDLSRTRFIAGAIDGSIIADQMINTALRSLMLVGADESFNLQQWQKDLGATLADEKCRGLLRQLCSRSLG